MNVPMWRPLVALLAGALVLSTSQACVTANLAHQERHPGLPGGSFVQVTFHPKPWQKRVTERVDWRLYQLVAGERVLVYESDEGTWLSPPLSPGKYTLEVRGWEKPGGKRVVLERAVTKSFKLGPEELVTAEMVLQDYRPGLFTGVGLGIAGVIVYLIAQWSNDFHISLK